MNQLELFANYALRELLPQEMKFLMHEAAVETSKRGTVLISFSQREEREQFMYACHRYSFEVEFR